MSDTLQPRDLTAERAALDAGETVSIRTEQLTDEELHMIMTAKVPNEAKALNHLMQE